MGKLRWKMAQKGRKRWNALARAPSYTTTPLGNPIKINRKLPGAGGFMQIVAAQALTRSHLRSRPHVKLRNFATRRLEKNCARRLCGGSWLCGGPKKSWRHSRRRKRRRRRKSWHNAKRWTCGAGPKKGKKIKEKWPKPKQSWRDSRRRKRRRSRRKSWKGRRRRKSRRRMR